uniref:NRF domain-containing protein n=1 Tax=Angiostrongylus cantonensis TaxID=6313 RepID=A0A158P9B6_ANGCA
MWTLWMLFVSAAACSLCPLRVPPRPRPLDQYKLPTIPDFNLETMPVFCTIFPRLIIIADVTFFTGYHKRSGINDEAGYHNGENGNFSRELVVGEECRSGFEKLLCTTDQTMDSLICNGQAESVERCSACAKKWHESKWALSWWDSLGKPAAGVSDGNYYWLEKFDGKYCRVELEIPDSLVRVFEVEEGCPQTDPLAIVLGVCMPSSCTDDELHRLVERYSPYKTTIDCELDVRFSTAAVIILVIFGFWVMLQIAVTVVDSDSLLLMCLNIKLNTRRALSTKRAPQSLHALHGLEFIAFIWLITGMVYNLMQPYIENVAFSYDAVSSLTVHPTNNYSYLVDGLLAMSALYTTYLLYGEMSSLNDLLHIVRRTLLRFWPAYAFCVLFMWILFPELSSGPLWIHTETAERCSNSWWKNVLFINNLFGVRDTCVDFGYVVSLEAQYFVPLIALIYLARTRLLLAKIIASSLMSVSILIGFYRTYAGALPPAPLLTAEPIELERTEQMLNMLLISPLVRASPTLVGFLFGVCMWNEDGPVKKNLFGRLFTVLVSVFCLLSALFVMFSLHPFATSSVGHPVFLACYAAFHRPLWAWSLLSFLYLSHHGSFEWIHAILTWRIFSPLSKLTWVALTVSEPMILYFFSALHRPSYATNWSTVSFLRHFLLLIIFTNL